MALMMRIQMLDKNKCHSGVNRQSPEHLRERLQTAGRCANPNNRERGAPRRTDIIAGAKLGNRMLLLCVCVCRHYATSISE